jgi:hypothetical protein
MEKVSFPPLAFPKYRVRLVFFIIARSAASKLGEKKGIIIKGCGESIRGVRARVEEQHGMLELSRVAEEYSAPAKNEAEAPLPPWL